MGAAVAQHHEERDRGVDGVGVVAVPEGVAVPHRVGVAAQLAAALVEAAVLLAEAVDVLVVPQALPDPRALARHRDPALGVVLVQRLAGGGGEGDAEGIVADRDLERAWS